MTEAERLARLETERDELARELGRARGVLAAVLVKLDPEAGGFGCGFCIRLLREALQETPPG
ncbi:MAG TPA: hypothetical protein VG370_34870 [Chloroflexota bacterium]|nr:hypothetical protein [Chloroflexota bacterium]